MNEQNQRRRRRTGAEIEQMLERYHRSGLTQARFAEQEGICLATLTRHLRKARSTVGPTSMPTSPVRFVEVERGAELLASGAALRAERRADGYRLRFDHGAELEIPAGFSPAEVTHLVRLVSALRGCVQ